MSVPKRPVHIFFSPPRYQPEPIYKKRQDNFVLDCTNPMSSKMRSYNPDEDHFSQSYLNVVFARLQSQKENRYYRSSDPLKNPEKTVSGDDFRSFLSQKINAVNKVKQNEKQLLKQSYLNSVIEERRVKTPQVSKHGAFVEHKFRCFKKKNRPVCPTQL